MSLTVNYFYVGVGGWHVSCFASLFEVILSLWFSGFT